MRSASSQCYGFADRLASALAKEPGSDQKLEEVSAYVIKLAEECDDLYGRAISDRDDDLADYQVIRLTAINQIGRKLGCLVEAK